MCLRPVERCVRKHQPVPQDAEHLVDHDLENARVDCLAGPVCGIQNLSERLTSLSGETVQLCGGISVTERLTQNADQKTAMLGCGREGRSDEAVQIRP